jgi:putative transposase
MRLPRIKLPEKSAIHHVIVRCAAGEMLLGDEEKELLRTQLEKTAGFCGIEVLAYVFLSNHYHLLLRVPPLASQADLSLEVVLSRVGALYGAHVQRDLAKDLASEAAGDVEFARAALQRYRGLMGDLSQFMKLYKMRFTRWYNAKHGRFGTLWAERFKSLLVQDSPEALQALAAYIDLNCVRAGLCDDPKDYRYCSYSEALAMPGMARSGLESVFAVDGGVGNEPVAQAWDEVQARYRNLMFGTVAVTSVDDVAGTVPLKTDKKGKHGVSLAKIREVRKAGGQLGLITVFRHRVRYFSQGVALGNSEFVEGVFDLKRGVFGSKRKTGARKLRGALGGLLAGLRTLRDLRG